MAQGGDRNALEVGLWHGQAFGRNRQEARVEVGNRAPAKVGGGGLGAGPAFWIQAMELR